MSADSIVWNGTRGTGKSGRRYALQTARIRDGLRYDTEWSLLVWDVGQSTAARELPTTSKRASRALAYQIEREGLPR
jgi:hypothetical protein